MAKADMGRKSAARAALKAQRRARRKAKKEKSKPPVVATAPITDPGDKDADDSKETMPPQKGYDPAKDPILKAADKAEVIEEKAEPEMGTKKPPMPKKKKKKDEDEE